MTQMVRVSPSEIVQGGIATAGDIFELAKALGTTVLILGLCAATHVP